MPKKRRKNIGDFYLGDKVVVDGEMYRIEAFISRRTVKIQSLSNQEDVFQVSCQMLSKVTGDAGIS